VRDWLIEGSEKITSFWSIAGLTVLAAINSPVLGLLALMLWIVLVAYADLNGIGKLLLGSAHWLAQVIAMVALYIGLTNLSIYFLNFIATDFGVLYIRTGAGTIYSIAQAFLYWAEMVFIGGIGAGLVWGAYLTLCSLVGVHCDQAFSSMSIATYKNFLRFKVEPDKLTIYPIGLRRPPARSSWRYRKQGEDSAGSGPAVVPAQSLKPQLIEGPIEIRVGDVKRREPQLQSS